jgi:hypothetical protein
MDPMNPDPNIWPSAKYHPQIVPSYRGNPFIEALPPIATESEIAAALSHRIEYADEHRNLPNHIREHLVMQTSGLVQPLDWQIELAARLDLQIRTGYVPRNPVKREFVARILNVTSSQLKEDRHTTGLWGNANSFAVTGPSGIGKSTAIRAILNNYPQVLVHLRYAQKPFYKKQIVWLRLECPHDGSIKNLGYAFFAAVDSLIGTDYFATFARYRGSTDLIITQMAKVAAAQGLGILVIDEINNLLEARIGNQDLVLNLCVQINNVLNIPILLLGTQEAIDVVGGQFKNARRNSGFGALNLGFPSKADFRLVCELLWQHQYLEVVTPLTEEMLDLLYNLTCGVIDLLVKLFQLAHVRAFASDSITGLTTDLFLSVYCDCFELLHPHLQAIRTDEANASLNFDRAVGSCDFVKMVKQAKEGQSKFQTINVEQEEARRPAPTAKKPTSGNAKSDLVKASREGRRQGKTSYDGLNEAGMIASIE